MQIVGYLLDIKYTLVVVCKYLCIKPIIAASIGLKILLTYFYYYENSKVLLSMYGMIEYAIGWKSGCIMHSAFKSGWEGK